MCFCVQIPWVLVEAVWLGTQSVRSPLNCWSSARWLRLIGQQLAIIFCVWSEGFSACSTLHCVSLSLSLPFQLSQRAVKECEAEEPRTKQGAES